VGSIPTRSRHSRRVAIRRRARRAAQVAAVIGGLAAIATTARGQERDSARSGVTPVAPPALLAPRDSAPPASDAKGGAPPAHVASLNPAVHPPITARAAFFSSLAVPGLGQAKLDRSYAGALFFLTEIIGIYRLRQAEIDLHYAQRHLNDSTRVVLTYEQDSSGQVQFDSTGAPIPATFGYARYDSARVDARKTHVEDWEAVLVFNHLISAADAFVAAQLWDLPAHVRPKVARTEDGRMLYGATVTW